MRYKWPFIICACGLVLSWIWFGYHIVDEAVSSAHRRDATLDCERHRDSLSLLLSRFMSRDEYDSVVAEERDAARARGVSGDYPDIAEPFFRFHESGAYCGSSLGSSTTVGYSDCVNSSW